MEMDEGERLFLDLFHGTRGFEPYTFDEFMKIKFPRSWYGDIQDREYFWPEVMKAYKKYDF